MSWPSAPLPCLRPCALSRRWAAGDTWGREGIAIRGPQGSRPHIPWTHRLLEKGPLTSLSRCLIYCAHAGSQTSKLPWNSSGGCPADAHVATPETSQTSTTCSPALPPCVCVAPSGLTSCSAVALCPVTSLHIMMCSSRITWKEDRMGLQSSTKGERAVSILGS